MTITLANLHEATPQQVFDQVAAHLLKQARQSCNEKDVCMYRNADGLKCAAGCLISDEEHNEDFEGRRWRRVVELFGVPAAHYCLIESLQDIHDCFTASLWKGLLKKLATERNLTWNFEE